MSYLTYGLQNNETIFGEHSKMTIMAHISNDSVFNKRQYQLSCFKWNRYGFDIPYVQFSFLILRNSLIIII